MKSLSNQGLHRRIKGVDGTLTCTCFETVKEEV